MKSQVLHTVWRSISGEAAGESWHWSLSGVKGLSHRNFALFFETLNSSIIFSCTRTVASKQALKQASKQASKHLTILRMHVDKNNSWNIIWVQGSSQTSSQFPWFSQAIDDPMSYRVVTHSTSFNRVEVKCLFVLAEDQHGSALTDVALDVT